MWDITVAIMCLTFLDHIALWIVVALHLRYAGIYHQYYGWQAVGKRAGPRCGRHMPLMC